MTISQVTTKETRPSDEEDFLDEEEIQYVSAENRDEDEDAHAHKKKLATEEEFHHISADWTVAKNFHWRLRLLPTTVYSGAGKCWRLGAS
jgi:hypothetical protein